MNTFKIMLVGEGGVGKTTLVKRLSDGNFEQRYIATLGVEVTPLRWNNVCLNVWDCAGQEKFRGLGEGYYVESHALVAMFDLTSLATFQNLPKWIETYKNPIVLVGTKCDMPNKEVSEEQIRNFMNRYNCKYFEISSKSNYQFDKPFNEVIKILMG